MEGCKFPRAWAIMHSSKVWRVAVKYIRTETKRKCPCPFQSLKWGMLWLLSSISQRVSGGFMIFGSLSAGEAVTLVQNGMPLSATEVSMSSCIATPYGGCAHTPRTSLWRLHLLFSARFTIPSTSWRWNESAVSCKCSSVEEALQDKETVTFEVSSLMTLSTNTMCEKVISSLLTDWKEWL